LDATGAAERVSTDAILPTQPEFTKLIIARKKNYEYKMYKVCDMGAEDLDLYYGGDRSDYVHPLPSLFLPRITIDAPPIGIGT